MQYMLIYCCFLSILVTGEIFDGATFVQDFFTKQTKLIVSCKRLKSYM
jgi:hypothetical protein